MSPQKYTHPEWSRNRHMHIGCYWICCRWPLSLFICNFGDSSLVLVISMAAFKFLCGSGSTFPFQAVHQALPAIYAQHQAATTCTSTGNQTHVYSSHGRPIAMQRIRGLTFLDSFYPGRTHLGLLLGKGSFSLNSWWISGRKKLDFEIKSERSTRPPLMLMLERFMGRDFFFKDNWSSSKLLETHWRPTSESIYPNLLLNSS